MTRWFHSHAQISQEEQMGRETDHEPQAFSSGNKTLKTLGYKNLLGLQWLEKLPVSKESPLERLRGS